MEAKSPRRILKRACAAQILESVLLQKPADFHGAIWSNFRSRQPALHFRCQVIRSADRVRLQAGFAKKLQQFTERKRADVRWIAQNFPAVLIRRPFGMFAGVNIFHYNRAASAANTRHLAQHL